MSPTVAVIGVGPGLGMSIAHRFGREGHRVAIVSRGDSRHAGYLASLAGAGIEAASFVADIRDHERLLSTMDAIAEHFGGIDVMYYGPGAADLTTAPKPITEIEISDVQAAMGWVYPAIDVVGKVLPGMTERGHGGLLFAGGLSSVMPMPALGSLAVASAALRNYALTLNAGLAEHGIYAGTLTIGGLIERGDIHQSVVANPDRFGDTGFKTLNPDEIADTAWQLYTKRDRAEAVISARPMQPVGMGTQPALSDLTRPGGQIGQRPAEVTQSRAPATRYAMLTSISTASTMLNWLSHCAVDGRQTTARTAAQQRNARPQSGAR
jgi:NAD(P)-dependent dehydrogenase (short-subunit alcohol dehydrogenase family)